MQFSGRAWREPLQPGRRTAGRTGEGVRWRWWLKSIMGLAGARPSERKSLRRRDIQRRDARPQVRNHCGDHHLSNSKGPSVARVANQGRSQSCPFSRVKPKGGPQDPRYRSAYVAAERQSVQTLQSRSLYQDRLAAHRLNRPTTRTSETLPVFSRDVLSRSIGAV